MSGTPLEVYEKGRARGLRFRLLGGGRVEIVGPCHVLEAMDAEITRHAKWLVAVAEEFDDPVAAAEELIIPRR